MSLKEAYTLAHTAQCRLQMEVNRPERNLRFVVGHLMHYEHLRLRILLIENDLSKQKRANSSVAFQGTGHVDGDDDDNYCTRLRHKPSTGQLGRKKSPPPPPIPTELHDDDDDNEEDDEDSDDEFADEVAGIEAETLSLTRFPSGSAQPPRAPPDLIPDEPSLDNDEYDEDDDEPVSPPDDPDPATLEQALKAPNNETLAKYYNSTRRCPCHGKKEETEVFGRVWELPAPAAGEKERIVQERKGREIEIRFAVAEVEGP